MELDSNDNYSERNLRRFLYTGQPGSKYVAGKYKRKDFGNILNFNFENYDIDDVLKIAKIFESVKKNSSFSAPIIYALAVTIRGLPKEDKKYKIREAFYQVVPIILQTSKDLMLFVKYTTELGLKKGTRWRNCIKTWYMRATYDVLVNDIASIRNRFDWEHKDILRLIHLTPHCGKEQAAALNYIWFGLKGLSELDVPKHVMENLGFAEKLRKTDTFHVAAFLIKRINGITLTQVPHHLLYSTNDNAEVWRALMDKIDVSDILHNIEYLQNAGMLEAKIEGKNALRTQLTSHVIKALSKAMAPPILAYIVYCNYKNNKGFLRIKQKSGYFSKSHIQTIKKNQSNGGVKRYIPKSKMHKYKHEHKCKPSADLIEVLKSLVDRSLQNVKTLINANILIVLDMQRYMFKSFALQNTLTTENNVDCGDGGTGEQFGVPNQSEKNNEIRKPAKCFYSKSVVPAHAGIILALYLSKYFNKALVGVYTKDGIRIVKLFKNVNNTKQLLTLEEAETALLNAPLGHPTVSKPFEWAIANKKPLELFVNIVDTSARMIKNSVSSSFTNISEVLSNYRLTMNTPKTRVMTISLATQNSATTKISDDGVFDISGFDHQIPELIQNYALGEFE